MPTTNILTTKAGDFTYTDKDDLIAQLVARLDVYQEKASAYDEAMDYGSLPRELFFTHNGVSIYYTLYKGCVSGGDYSTSKYGGDIADSDDDGMFDVNDLPNPDHLPVNAYGTVTTSGQAQTNMKAVIAAAIDAGLIDEDGYAGDEDDGEEVGA